jgi:replicative DNA helicase
LRCFDPGDSASDIIQAGEKLLLDISETGKHKSAEMMNPGQVVEDAGGLQKFLSPMRGAGISTPFSRLTEITGGYRRGELIVIAGNPGMGKTSLGIQAAGHVAEQGEGALVFSMEMSRAALVERIACSRARVDSARLRAGYVTAEERARLSKAVTEIWDWPLWIAENGVSNTLAIRAALRRQRQKGEVFMLVIDYLQLMKPIGKFQNRHAEISEITRSLKLLAMDEKVNIQLLSQLTRENMREKRPPALHDLRESSSIESDADSVQAAWREELLRPDRDDLKGLADLIVLKQRNGRIGKIQLIFVANFSKFEARAEDLPYAPTPERSPYND